ncbi:MAG TPA: hypothetical protein VGJ57_07635 [Nitrospirales bacterium]
MKPSLTLALACMIGLGMSTAGFAADPPGRSDAKPSDAKAETKATLAPAEIKGEVLKIDGDNFVVNDERSKKEVKFTIEKDVKATLDRPLKQGDRIEAYLTPEGLAKKVRFEGVKDQDMQNRAGRDAGGSPSPGGFPQEMPASGQSGPQDQGGMKAPEGSNPTLSPGGKGSASGG